MAEDDKIAEALQILGELGMPRAQQNHRSALCLLALLNLTQEKSWARAEHPLVGITPMMEFARDHYGKLYAPNSRETFRRQTIHQMVAAGIALYNPDNPSRPVNSPKVVYRIEGDTLRFATQLRHGRVEQEARKVPENPQDANRAIRQRAGDKETAGQAGYGDTIRLSPGDHSELIKAIIEEFAPRYVPGGVLVYAGERCSRRQRMSPTEFTLVLRCATESRESAAPLRREVV